MDVVVFALILVALAAFVAAPLYRVARLSAPPPEATELEARRDTVTAALSDLEIDRESGLISEAEYERERSALDPEG